MPDLIIANWTVTAAIWYPAAVIVSVFGIAVLLHVADWIRDR